MPYARKIGEIDQAIAELRDAIGAMRRGQTRPGGLERALGELARLRAARTRLMLRQISAHSDGDGAASDPPARAEKPKH
jgi:hypothetical protein